jgi:hypothetical protein
MAQNYTKDYEIQVNLLTDVTQIHFWAFLLASRRSRRATGYASASVLTHLLRNPPHA